MSARSRSAPWFRDVLREWRIATGQEQVREGEVSWAEIVELSPGRFVMLSIMKSVCE